MPSKLFRRVSAVLRDKTKQTQAIQKEALHAAREEKTIQQTAARLRRQSPCMQTDCLLLGRQAVSVCIETVSVCIETVFIQTLSLYV